jgi:large subunit ribosomal protein L23
MPLFDIFKKRKRGKEKKIRKEKPVKKEAEKKVTPQSKSQKRVAKAKTTSKLAYRILKSPHITEKATELASKNQYTFLVWPEANKVEIKKAIEDLYKVKVTDVNIINIPPKKRRLGRTLGWRKKYKKAIVAIQEGQKIDIFPK